MQSVTEVFDDEFSQHDLRELVLEFCAWRRGRSGGRRCDFLFSQGSPVPAIPGCSVVPPLDGRGLAEEGRGMATQGRGEAGAGGRRKGSTEAGSGSQLCCGLFDMSAHQQGTELGKGPQSLPLLSIVLDPLLPPVLRRSVPWPGIPEASARPVGWRRRGGSNPGD